MNARYQVQLQQINLAPGKSGQAIGAPYIMSYHRTLRAAGDRLASYISGKRQGAAALVCRLGNHQCQLSYLVLDRVTDLTYTRRDCKWGTGGKTLAERAHARTWRMDNV